MNVEERILEMIERLADIERKLDNALEKLNDHESRLRALEGKNSARWDKLVGEVIKLVAVGTVGYLISKGV